MSTLALNVKLIYVSTYGIDEKICTRTHLKKMQLIAVSIARRIKLVAYGYTACQSCILNMFDFEFRIFRNDYRYSKCGDDASRQSEVRIDDGSER
jgi:hypothetical protein